MPCLRQWRPFGCCCFHCIPGCRRRQVGFRCRPGTCGRSASRRRPECRRHERGTAAKSAPGRLVVAFRSSSQPHYIGVASCQFNERENRNCHYSHFWRPPPKLINQAIVDPRQTSGDISQPLPPHRNPDSDTYQQRPMSQRGIAT